MDRFSRFHPVVLFLYYIAGFCIVLTVNDPVFSLISLAGALLYYARTNSTRIISRIKLVAFILAFVSVFNMLFAHYGEDILFKIGDTDFTLEALFYGFNQGVVLSGVILWFELFSNSLDSEKIIYAFRFTPKIALIISMVLGFIPRFTKKLYEIREAQLGLNGGNTPKNLKSRLEQARDNLSALVTYCLESSIITADSMEARGYNQRAVVRSRYTFKIVDFFLMITVFALLAVIVVIKILGGICFIFEPVIYYESYSIIAFICFAVLEAMPFIIDSVEDIRWKLLYAKK